MVAWWQSTHLPTFGIPSGDRVAFRTAVNHQRDCTDSTWCARCAGSEKTIAMYRRAHYNLPSKGDPRW